MYASTDVLYSSSILVVKAVACKQGKPLEDFLLSVTVSSAGLSVRLVSSDESFRRQECLKPRPSTFLQYHRLTIVRQYNDISIFYTDRNQSRYNAAVKNVAIAFVKRFLEG